MTNSIYRALEKESLLAELRLQLSAPNNSNRPFVVLEGIDDIALFTPLFSNQCFLFESYGGKEAIEDIIHQYFTDHRVIGIRDKDYLQKPSCDRVFFCDNCNAEMMIVGDDECFSSIIIRIARGSINPIELRDKILDSLKGLSATRKANDERAWGITLNTLSIDYLFKQSNPIQTTDLIGHINRKNKTPISSDMVNVIVAEIAQIKNNLLNYTNGHDFCSALNLFLQKMSSYNSTIKSLSADTIHAFLLTGYNSIYFRKTALYHDLNEYQRLNGLNSIL